MKLLIHILIFLLSSYSLCLSISSMNSLRSNTLLQTRIRMSALSDYLNNKPQIDLDINQIKGKSQLYAFYGIDQTKIYISPDSSPSNKTGAKIAEGEYLTTRFKTGWDKFNSKTYSTANPIVQCYSAGIIEGLLSWEEIYSYRMNYEYFFTVQEDIVLLKSFLAKVDEHIKEKLTLKDLEYDTKEKDIKILSYLACLHAQINGLFQGYSLIAPDDKKLELSDLYFLNTEGYYSYLLNYLSLNDVKVENKNDFNSDENLMKYYNTNKIEEIWQKLIRRSHCSAIIKLIDNKGKRDLFVGHNTWTGYNELLRTLKHVYYEFEGDNQVIGMKPFEMKYSSYPGILFSGDEFYEKNRMVVMQTSLSVINQFQYKDAIQNQNEYIPEFMRIMIINFLSDNGKEWVENYKTIFKNNHIYIAQWMVIDYDRLNEDSELLYIVEEYPKSVKTMDYTKLLIKDSYYGSFNLPLFKEDHSEIAGFSNFKKINFFGKDYNPRKYLLDQLETDIHTLEDFKNTLMYNGYKKKSKIKDDPSYTNPSNGLASRDKGGHEGAIDFKIVNKQLVNESKIWVFSGPVYETNKNFGIYDLEKENPIIIQYSKGIPKFWNFKPFIYF